LEPYNPLADPEMKEALDVMSLANSIIDEIFSPCFKCFSFDQTKLPLNEILLLMFKRVFRY
jgi:hypothetical protein